MLLHLQQHFSLVPQLFQFIIPAQINIKEMDDNIPVINDHPAGIRSTFDAAFLFMLYERFFDNTVCQGIQHAIAGGSTDNKVVCKGNDPFKIQQNNIFAFLVFQGIDNRVCKFQWFQESPRFYFMV